MAVAVRGAGKRQRRRLVGLGVRQHLFRKRDHAVGELAQLLGLRHRRLDALVLDQLRDHRPAGRGVWMGAAGEGLYWVVGVGRCCCWLQGNSTTTCCTEERAYVAAANSDAPEHGQSVRLVPPELDALHHDCGAGLLAG